MQVRTLTVAELLESKFLSFIGKSTGDYELKKKIRKSDMTVEAITDAIHEYMYEKLNDSPETEEKKKVRHVEKRKLKSTRDQTEWSTKSRRIDCNSCGAPNWSKQHECPARGKQCVKFSKMGHNAKCCRASRKINHVAEEETYSAEDDEWTPDRIHSEERPIVVLYSNASGQQ